MRQVRFLMVYVSAMAIGLTGCGGSGNDVAKTAAPNKGVEAAVEKEGQFPKFLAGAWDCNDGMPEGAKLEIVIEPNGVIFSANTPFGTPKLRSGERVDFNNVETGGRGFYEAGQFSADYKPATRELKVELPLECYRIETEDGGIIEGTNTDILVGKVSEDGKTWQANWFALTDTYITTEFFKHFLVPSDPNEVFEVRATLTFRKAASP